ncbi:MAG: LPS assembly protein LptD [Candidatus Omnitrophota bacterium]
MHQAKIPACRQAEKFKIQRYLKVFNFGLSFWFFIFSATLLGGPAKIFGGGILACAFAQEGTKEPVIVDGDKVEFFSEEKKVTAEGNVIVSQKKAKLVCDKVTVYTETQDAIAEGHVRFYYEKGVLFAEKFIYNFQSKKGKLIDADIESPPYYGKGQFAEKVSEYELKIKHGYFTTCDEKNPHYKLRSKKLNIFPGDKVVAKEVLFQVGKFPLMYLPSYTHPIDDRRPRVTVLPGRTKDWGYFLLSAWRYYFTENAMGRFHVDYREKKDVAWGFDHKYKIENMGEGLFKTYYMNERSISAKHVYEIYDEERNTVEKERFRIQLRHKWEINPQETAILEYNKIKDATFLKDYFLREYEEDGQPSSYFLYTRSLPEYTFSFYTKKRTNRIFAEVERLPEMKIETPDLNITRLFLEDNSPTSDKGLQFELQKTNAYFKNSTSFSNLVSKGVVPDSEVSDQAKRFDTYNQLSLQRKFVFIETRPHAGFRETFYSKDRYNDENLFRGIFDSGIDLSTKFYRIFDVTSDFMDIEINKLRHIITPTASYSYVHPPTIPSSKLNYFDSLDSIGQTNKMSLALSNKFQTKRENNTIDFVNFTVSSDYSFKPKGDRGSSFSDFLFDLETIPYEWLRIEADATYDHFEDYFKTVNSDLTANITDKTSASFGYRYQRKSTRDYITNFNYRINPKWWFSVYERFEQLGRGLTEQEYTIERDLHCWTMAFTYSVKRGRGEEIWLVFSIKAFPEMGFEFNKSYRAPKRGTQFGGP